MLLLLMEKENKKELIPMLTAATASSLDKSSELSNI